MEVAFSPQVQKQNLQITGRKILCVGSQKDLWLVVREGSLNDVELALASLKKSGGNINLRNTFGLTPLHIASWRNHIPIVRRLLAAGADPDARDGESGWSSLHRALHFGHLAAASILLQHGASITLEDSKSRIPVDLLSGSVFQALGNEHSSVATEVFSWGSGANYQLGTGNAHIQKLPCKVDSLGGSFIKLISAGKFHSVALTARGELYTWGFGRGGRLGHPDFDIHSGQAAVITPRQVTSGLGSRRVMAIAAAKHHTVIATQGGEVFTWGSNREGQLGYPSVDTQPTPRRVSSLRSKIVAVAAANKHTAVVSDLGEVFTWGCNREGQLGYGTSNSASNYTPHVVESLKGKTLTRVSAAKYHTIVLGSDGEVFTWGHRLVTPKRVVVSRNLKKSGNTPLKFHRKERLSVVSVAAGMVHSMALTDDGALFYWVSSDPDLRCQQLYAMCGRNMVNISAGKYWTAAVTATGDVYMWDGKKGKDKPLVATRLHGVKKATSVSVGETHLLIVASLYHPLYAPNMIQNSQKLKLNNGDDMEELNEDILFEDIDFSNMISSVQNDTSRQRSIPSLKSLCEKVAAECLVEPRNAVQLLEIADSLGADDLKKYCEEIVMRNLDYIFTVSSHTIASASPDVLANLERLLDQRSSEPWSHRRLPTPTATLPAIINSEEDDSEIDCSRLRCLKISSLVDIFLMTSRLQSFNLRKGSKKGKLSKKQRRKIERINKLSFLELFAQLRDAKDLAFVSKKGGLSMFLIHFFFPVQYPLPQLVVPRPSLRDIQMQQGKKQQSLAHSPTTRTSGFSIATGQGGSPSETTGVSRWFKPEVETPSSIRSIQIEEKAMKDLKRFYSRRERRKFNSNIFFNLKLDVKPNESIWAKKIKSNRPGWLRPKIEMSLVILGQEQHASQHNEHQFEIPTTLSNKLLFSFIAIYENFRYNVFIKKKKLSFVLFHNKILVSCLTCSWLSYIFLSVITFLKFLLDFDKFYSYIKLLLKTLSLVDKLGGHQLLVGSRRYSFIIYNFHISNVILSFLKRLIGNPDAVESLFEGAQMMISTTRIFSRTTHLKPHLP
ncbi:PH, RCC1 and FYVE domains-containing protein [Vigna angularis]|uniref:PH, RCC1 and FYVE domains-containing protein n=1 Tax=Phaseolus angularis TaxID=3914 RepID=A0A8T0L056_PHAAN|nr:PH, RCC1 and FYVE domains-containing protein [Vigna angularis]